ILGPEKYGEFSVGFAIVLILTRIVDFGLNTAIVKFAGEDNQRSDKNFIYSYTLKLKLFITVLLFLIGLVSYQTIAQFLGLREPLIILLSFTFGLATGYYEYLISILQSLHLFGRAVFVNAVQAIVKLIVAIALLWLGTHNLLPPYFWYIFAPFIPFTLFKFLLPKWLKLNFSLKNKPLTKKIQKLATHASIGLIAAGIIENIDILFVQKYLNTYETGLYGGVSRVALFFAIVAYSLGNVLNARVARYKSQEHLAKYLKKALVLALLIILSFIFFVPLAKPVILLTIGAEYLQAQNILLILTAASFFALAAIPFIALFYALEADWYFSVSGILQLLIVLVGNFIYVPSMGLEAAAWTRFVVRLFLLIFSIVVGYLAFKRQYKPIKTWF
ncbi:MAG: oligosaccharide flippase family protein, partial [Candidatus Pacebacteria bacterium]|nr:oligosaccharide flippase family protein [Candidatus Paceibacterota bacterium]